MKQFKNHQRPRRKYRFDIVGHKKALKIWYDSPFKTYKEIVGKRQNSVSIVML
jgi:hypothetical protein